MTTESDRWNDALIRWARGVARRIGAREGLRGANLDDARDAGLVGLWFASRTYTPGPVPYRAWARTCIRREVYELGRSLDWGTNGRTRPGRRACPLAAWNDERESRFFAPNSSPEGLVAVLELREMLDSVLVERADGLTMREIGARRGVSESRASQLVSAARERARERLRDYPCE